MVRVVLPYPLQVLAGSGREVDLPVNPPVTIASTLASLESRFPMLQGAVLDHVSRKRRPLIRFFACTQDLSHVPLETPLPESVASGKDPFFIVGAIAGG